MKQSQKNPILLLSVGIAALFLLGFLLLVTFGARSYREVVESQYGNMDERALSAYITTSVKANDSRGALRAEDSEYGQVLVVTDVGMPATGRRLRPKRRSASARQSAFPSSAAITGS